MARGEWERGGGGDLEQDQPARVRAPGKTSLTSGGPGSRASRGTPGKVTGTMQLAAAPHAPAFGLAAGEVPVHAGDEAQARNRAEGAAGLYAGGQILLDPEHATDTGQGRALLGHELAHAAQARLPRPAGGYDVGAAEAEADQLGLAYAMGVTHLRPRHAIAPDRLAAKKLDEVGSTKEAKDDTLPEGVNVSPRGGMVLVRKSWFEQGGPVDWSATAVYRPTKIPRIVNTVRHHFWWMTDDDLERAKKWPLRVDGREPGDFFLVDPYPGIYGIVGLPPGSKIEWKKEGSGAHLWIQATELPAPLGGKPVPLDLALKERIADRLEAWTEEPMDPAKRAAFVKGEWTGMADGTRKAMLYQFSYDDMAHWLGDETWQGMVYRTVVSGGDGGPEFTSAYAGLRFADGIILADRDYYLAWIERLFGKGSHPKQGKDDFVTQAGIEALRKVDEHEIEDAIVEQLKVDPLRANHLDPQIVNRAIAYAHMGIAREKLDIAPPTGPTKQKRFERPVPIRLVNRGGLAWVGKSVTFEVELTESLYDIEPILILAPAKVWIDWRAHPRDDPSSQKKTNTGGLYYREEHRTWSTKFPRTGVWVVHAFVSHDMYADNYASMEVEVKTRDERQSELEEQAFQGMGGKDDEYFRTDDFPFPESAFGELFNEKKHGTGDFFARTLPADFERLPLEKRMSFLGRDKKSLELLIKRYKARTDRSSKEIVDYAESLLEKLGSHGDKVEEDAKDGWTYIESRASFLSDKSDLPDGMLNLVTMVKAEPGKDVQIRIRDFTMLYEQKVYTYEASEKDFFFAIRDVFTDLCKSYPPGTMSVLFEEVKRDTPESPLKPSGSSVGFSLHTDTRWENVKRTVWDPAVQIAVNVIGTAVMIFVPGSGLIIFPTLVAYNAVDVIDNLAQLKSKGVMEDRDVAEGVMMIGLDLLPLIGKAKVFAKFGRYTMWTVEGVEIAGQSVIMTQQGKRAIEEIRDGYVMEIAQLNQQIQEIEAVNPSDPRLPEKKAQLEKKIREARGAAVKYWTKAAATGAIMLVPGAVFNRMAASFRGKTLDTLADEKVFVHERGAKGSYDSDYGRITGDRNRITDAEFDELKRAYATDMYAKRAEIANQLGVEPDHVIIKRSPSKGGRAKFESEGGDITVTVPAGRKFEDVYKDAWTYRKKELPGAPDERPAKLEVDVKPSYRAKDVVSGRNVILGHRVPSASEGHAILRRLASGDRTVFAEIGVDIPPKSFDPSSVEWGLGHVPDGYVIIRGAANYVNWSALPPGVRPIAHAHPITPARRLAGKDANGGIEISKMAVDGGGKTNAANVLHLFPSASDVIFTARNGGPHVVHTPYVHKGKGKVGNPKQGVEEPQVEFVIDGAELAGTVDKIDWLPIYKAEIVARAGGKEIWRGEVWGIHDPRFGSELHFSEPSFLVKTKPSAPGSGRATGAAAPKMPEPKSDLEAKGIRDWQRLTEDVTRDYTGKFDMDEWIAHYAHGWEFDFESRRWTRPGARARAELPKFSAKIRPDKAYRELHDGSPSFRKYVAMLKRHGLASKDDIVGYIALRKPGGRSHDVIRHEVKQHFQKTVLEHLDGIADAGAAQKKLNEITRGLNSSDKGAISEAWYRGRFAPASKTHVLVDKGELEQRTGVELAKDRRPDLMGMPGKKTVFDQHTLGEIKSTDAKLGKDDLAQFDDLVKLVDQEVWVDGGLIEVKRVRYVFTSTDGARANAGWIRDQLDTFAGKLSFEVFDPAGTRLLVSTSDQLDDAKFAWMTSKKKKP